MSSPAVPEQGLEETEARRRLLEHGPNALPETAAVPLWRRFLRQFKSALIYVLLFALAFDLGVWVHEGAPGVPFEALLIALVLLLNSGLGTFQEYRSEQAIARLAKLSAPLVWVLRDGRLVHRPTADLVPGDAVRVEAGDRLAADGTLVEAHGFMVDESVLTGESVPVEKQDGDDALSGTLAVRGKAFLQVNRTGARSNMGKLATMLGRIQTDKTPLERRMDALGHQIARWVGALSAVLLVGGIATQGLGRIDEILLFTVALAVAAVPEGMPAIVTLTLSMGVQRMARRNAMVRRLAAVEALGSVTVIATDKTGTLTENHMTVAGLDSDDAAEAIAAMVIASDADTDGAAGDPLELGMLAYARAQGVDPADLRLQRPRRSARPFDSAWKFMRVTVEHDGRRISYLKGASEVVLARATLTTEERDRWSRRTEEEAARGHRVLGLAVGDEESEEGLRFLGLVMLWDPPRPEVPAAVRAVQDAGVRVLMITGDHPSTAQAIATKVGIDGAAAGVLTGADLDRLTPEERRAAIRRISVFARVTPEHKLAIVDALKADGEVVAVTGDGVNDAPALKRADVGVAMGQRGSDVAREVADLVLLDDNFASIVGAIEEGRGIYANIQKVIRFLFSTNVALVLLVVAGAAGSVALGLRTDEGALLLPLTAVQLLWINFLADGPPALALGIDRSHGLLSQAPRPRDSALLDGPALRFVLITGAFKAALGAALLVGLPWAGYGVVATITAVFLYESIAQLLFAFPARRLGAPPLHNLALYVSIILGTLLQIATIAIPGLRRALGLVPLDVAALAAVGGAIVATWVVAEATNHLLRQRTAAAPTTRHVSA